jgi:hypothetical protein
LHFLLINHKFFDSSGIGGRGGVMMVAVVLDHSGVHALFQFLINNMVVN